MRSEQCPENWAREESGAQQKAIQAAAAASCFWPSKGIFQQVKTLYNLILLVLSNCWHKGVMSSVFDVSRCMKNKIMS